MNKLGFHLLFSGFNKRIRFLASFYLPCMFIYTYTYRYVSYVTGVFKSSKVWIVMINDNQKSRASKNACMKNIFLSQHICKALMPPSYTKALSRALKELAWFERDYYYLQFIQIFFISCRIIL